MPPLYCRHEAMVTKQLQHQWEQDSQEGMGVWGVPLAVLALPLAVLVSR